MFLPDLGSVHDAETIRTLQRRRRRAAAGVLLAVLPAVGALLLPPGKDPNIVAILALTPAAILLGSGLLDGVALLLAPLLRPLLAGIPEGAVFHLDGDAWRLEGASAHQALAFHAAAARPGPRLALALIRRHMRLPYVFGGSLFAQESLVLLRIAGHQGAFLLPTGRPTPTAAGQGILCVGIPLLLERLPSAPAAPSPASPSLP